MRIAIYGTGGFGREVASMSQGDDTVFVTDTAAQQGTEINGLSVISFEQLCSRTHNDRQVVLAVASQHGRRALSEKCEAAGFRFITLRASTNLSFNNAQIGDGAILCDYTIITCNVRIGRHFHCNLFSYVAHDCIIGDFVTFAPRVNCNGRVLIEDDVFVGSGATLRDGTPGRPLRIGRGAVVGMGAVVTRDVAPGAIVVGSPARPLQR